MTFNANITDTNHTTENVLNVFNEMPPLHSSVQQTVTTPITSILGAKTPAIAFTLELFKQRPELFGIYGASVIYAQYSGTAYKPELVYDLFELFITRSSPTEIQARRTRKLSLYENDPDLLITWARLMQQTKTNIIFEPVMNNLGKVMNNWLHNRRVSWGGIDYDISTFRPLCYNRCGECYINLIPYICYILTFMIHCRPFTFNEAQTQSSTYGFYKALEEYYQLNYSALGNDFDIDVIHSSLEELRKIPDNYFVDLFKVMLNPDKIIEIRNAEIRKTENLLNECLTDQNSLTYEFIADAWKLTMTQMFKRIIERNPIKGIFNAMPRFKSNGNVNVYELADWTQYCLAGGDKAFCIEPESTSEMKGQSINYPASLHADPNSIKPLPTSIFGKQSLKSKIGVCSIAEGLPFCSADLILNMAKAFIHREFINKRNDPLDEHQITIDEHMLLKNKLERLNNKSLQEIVKDLFIPGLWMFDNSSMSAALDILMNNDNFVRELKDILSLTTVTQIVYDNLLASVVITPYIMSFLNTWLLNTCNYNYPLQFFSPYTYICQMEPAGNRIAKLCDMTIALCYIGSDDYANFVNNVMWRFQNIMINSPIIQQPYIKGLNDLADIYAIGGCELYNYAKFSNPLVRGYGWVSNVSGTSEGLETYYKWIYGLQNNSLMELLEQSLQNSSMIEMNLKVQWTKMYASRTYPNLLANYEFNSSNNGYKLKSYPYVLDLKTSDGRSILEVILNRTYARSNVKSSIPQQIIFKPIDYSHGIVTAGVAQVNGMKVGNNVMPASMNETGLILKCPLYDYNGDMIENRVMYTTPGGYKLEMLYLISTRHVENQSIMIFTNTPRVSRYQNYLYESNNSAPYKDGDKVGNSLYSKFVDTAEGLSNVRANPRQKRDSILSNNQVVKNMFDKNNVLV